ncbi:hypothetical protein FRC04_011241 [Tulasnella sp. 424]|nr:hypothetical protein FRC04_011241 [Tulasnella sp. 424]
MSQSSTPNSIDVAMNPTQQALLAHSTLPVAVVPSTSAETNNARPTMSAVVERLTTLIISYESGIHAVDRQPETEQGLSLIPILIFVLAVNLILMAFCALAIQ